MKIVSIRSKSNYTQQQLTKLKCMGEFTEITGGKYRLEDIYDNVFDAEILLLSPSGIEKLSSDIVYKMKKLKFISLLSVGYDFIDISATKKRNILVSNIRGANAESVAEHIWAMILDLSKRVTEFDHAIRKHGEYDYRKYKGKEIFGKTIGVIGTGNIGKRVSEIAQVFNMTVLGNNKSGKDIEGIKIVGFKKLLRNSDVIVVCVPLTKETKNIISKEEISIMKDNVILVNCAREQIVNKNAILSGLKMGKVFGYGMETNNINSLTADDSYLKNERIIITCHNASNTEEAEIITNNMAIKNIKAFLNKKPQNLIY